MGERIQATSDGKFFYASSDEVKAHHDTELARAKGATADERMAIQDELTARINERIRGIEIEPGVLISRTHLGTLRAHIRAFIQTADYAGTYDFRLRHPGKH